MGTNTKMKFGKIQKLLTDDMKTNSRKILLMDLILKLIIKMIFV